MPELTLAIEYPKSTLTGFDHPEHDVAKLVKKMDDIDKWLWSDKKKMLHRGAWLTNRLKEQASGPQLRK